MPRAVGSDIGATSHERWRDVDRVFDGALTLPPHERVSYLDRVCAGDADLRTQVEALLASADASGFLEERAAAYAAPLFGSDTVAPNAAASPISENADTRIGPYRVVRELAHGGMGAVYVAERADGQFHQQVALKLIKREMDSDAIRARFLREREILARLQHPHIARLVDGGITESDAPWFAMEYVEGVAITAYCEAHQLRVGERIGLFLQVCEAVRFAHANLVVHRDLKPSNVLVTTEGWVKLLDFGISKLLHADEAEATAALTEIGVRLMTPDYASPEQVRGEPVTTATDVYALGTVLYELLSCQRAHRIERHTAAEVERVICEVESSPPSAVAPPHLRRELRGDVDTILAKALRKDPARRYASVEALTDDLRRYLTGLPVRARPDSRAYRMEKFVRRHRVGVAAAGAVFLALAGGLAGTVWQARAAAREAARATQEATKATEVKDFVVGLFDVANPAESRGRDITARELLERGARKVDSALASQPEVREDLLSELAGIYSDLGFHAQSDTLARRALALARSLHGDNHPETATRLTSLGAILWEQGEYARAESVLAPALAIRRRLGDDTLLAKTLNPLAAVYLAQGDLARAVAMDREVLALDRRHYGNDHLEVATDLNNLGIALWQSGELLAADSALRAALDIRRRQLDADHPETLISQHNLATVLGAMGNMREAEALERDVLTRRRRLYPQGHPDLGHALHQLAHYVSQQGRLEEADSLFAEAVATRERWLGASHPLTMTSLNNRAVVKLRMGELAIAEGMTRQVLASWRESLGPEHRNTLKAMNTLGRILAEQGKYASAERTLRQALESRRKVLGDRHEDVAQSLLQLGSVLRRSGPAEAAEAERVLRESLGIYRRAVPVGDVRIAAPLASLGALLTDRGRASEAEALLREALSIQDSTGGRDDPDAATTRRTLGLCLAALHRHEEAEAMLLQSYRAFTAAPYGTRERPEAARHLATFYEARGRRADAARFRKLAAQQR